MEASRVDTLRKAAPQVSRRQTLGALVGSALLLNDRGEIEATKRAKRRRKHKRRARRKIRPISILVDNTAGTQEVRVFRLEWMIGLCCFNQETVTIPAGETALFHSGLNEMGTHLNEKY